MALVFNPFTMQEEWIPDQQSVAQPQQPDFGTAPSGLPYMMSPDMRAEYDQTFASLHPGGRVQQPYEFQLRDPNYVTFEQMAKWNKRVDDAFNQNQITEQETELEIMLLLLHKGDNNLI